MWRPTRYPASATSLSGLSNLEGALAVYDKVDYIKVIPEASLARLGGDEIRVHPRGYQQLEAVAYQRGEDGKLHTSDDIELGPVDVNWSIEEFYAVFGDDDKEFVGSLNNNGMFTPISTVRIRSASSAAITTATSGWWQPRRARKTRKANRWWASPIWWLPCRPILSGISPRYRA